MKTAIVYYSKHHGNTKKLVDAIVAAHPDVDTFNAMEEIPDLSGYDCIVLAQASMAPMEAPLRKQFGIPVYSSPALCIAQVKEILEAQK